MEIEYYYSKNCGHCRKFSKTLESIMAERPYIELRKRLYDREQHPQVKYVPTVVVSHAGQELGRFTSALDKESIDGWLDQLEDYIETNLWVKPQEAWNAKT